MFEERMLPMKEVKRMLGVSRTTVYDLIGKGKIPQGVRMSDGRVCWALSWIQDYIDQCMDAGQGNRQRRKARPSVATGPAVPSPQPSGVDDRALLSQQPLVAGVASPRLVPMSAWSPYDDGPDGLNPDGIVPAQSDALQATMRGRQKQAALPVAAAPSDRALQPITWSSSEDGPDVLNPDGIVPVPPDSLQVLTDVYADTRYVPVGHWLGFNNRTAAPVMAERYPPVTSAVSQVVTVPCPPPQALSLTSAASAIPGRRAETRAVTSMNVFGAVLADNPPQRLLSFRNLLQGGDPPEGGW